MLNRFRHIVEEMRGLIDDSRSASFLLAVSGGIDSMCLADMWLRCFGPDSFAMAHCNFHLRGEESDGDEALVAGWAEEKGVYLHRIDFDTLGYAAENGLSIEMAARELRYTWFGELCDKHGYEAVVVAHHADDNAETLVLNMVRGAGLKGLTGMKPISSLSFRAISPLSFRASEASREISILRPLLTFSRKQIEGHVFAWKVPYREDSTNSSVEYRRNSIRHEVFPLFERMNPSYVRTLNREMTYLSDASSIVEEWCKEHVKEVIVPLSFRPGDQLSFRPSEASGEISISITSLLEIPQWRYLLYYILEPYGFNTSVLDSLENLLTSDRTISGKRFESDGYVLRTERGALVVYAKASSSSVQTTSSQSSRPSSSLSSRPSSSLSVRQSSPLSFRASEASREIYTAVRIPGAYHINGQRIVVETLPWTPGMPLKQPEGTLILDAAKLKFPFICRVWRNGDWLIPLGMKGKKKLSDLFTDLKYGHFEKEASLVIVDCRGDMAENQHVAAVLPVRIDDRYKVTSDTKEIIRIRITDNR